MANLMREKIVNRISQEKLTSAYLRKIDLDKPMKNMTDDELLDAFEQVIKQRSIMKIAEGMFHKLGEKKNESVDICSTIPK